ncbi:MAG: DUF2569 domain-containing protein [Candidatus Aminicenantes bacterium]|nr:DUF2569 domain-containing protein [Candidatus Aminicenantes bacterium]MDH5706746.1 DUF2569 domain-containing protein [Candidatus Aminicenantes bacterium]
MYLQIGIISAVMVIAYALAKWRKLSVELSMLSAAVAGGLAGAFVNTPPLTQLARHLIEGSFTYLDVILIFSTATIFMSIVNESGGVNYVVRVIIKYFYNVRIIALILLMIILLIPGALTGAGSVSLLVVGAPVALALGYLGIKKRRAAAILFIVAGLSAAAPPVNIWAMILCAGTAIPYVGFELPLGIPVLILGTFTVLSLGWRRRDDKELISKIIADMNSRSDEELLKIWRENDREEWRDEVFSGIEKILIERGHKLPPQRETQEIISQKEIKEESKYYGVKGWLLFFCIILTILSPILTSFVLIASYGEFLSLFYDYPALRVIAILYILINIGITIFGVVAGVKLWAKRPNAVRITRAYLTTFLLFNIYGGLLVFIMELLAHSVSGSYLQGLIGSFIYFFIWNSYFNKSKRVNATFKTEKERRNLRLILKEMPEVPPGMSWWRVILPFLVFFGMVIASRIWPFDTPILGLALEFAVAALVAWLVSPVKINILALSRKTMKRLLPLLATMIVVGMLQQIMTATGARGMISFAVISTPLILLFILLALIIPVSEGILTYGAAAIIGIPLVWFLDSIGLHATVVIAGLSLLWPLGDGLPPTALIGRLSVMVSEYRDSYWTFLRSTWLPWLVITIVGILMIIFSTQLDFLVR